MDPNVPISVLGMDIPVAVISGVAMLWAGALIVFDKRYAIRHMMTMLSALLFLVSQTLELAEISVYIPYRLVYLFSMMARYLQWCVLFEVVRTCVPGPMRSTQRIVPLVAYIWSAVAFIVMIVFAVSQSLRYDSVLWKAAPALFYVGSFGIVPFVILSYVVSSIPVVKTAISDFRSSFALFALLLTLVTVGVIIGMIPDLVSSGPTFGSRFEAFSIVSYILGSLLASMGLIMACACASKWVGFNSHDRLPHHGDGEEDDPFAVGHIHHPMGRHGLDDVYTTNTITRREDVGRF